MSTERLANGHFAKGHKGIPGAGNPHTKKIEAYRKRLYATTTNDEIDEMWSAIKAEVKLGNVKAADFVFGYLGLRPKKELEIIDNTQNVLFERLNATNTTIIS